MRTATSTLLACLLTLPAGADVQQSPANQGSSGSEQPATRFRSSVQMVTIAAVIRDEKGRLVRDLSREDVQVLDKGAPRAIREFRAEAESPVSVALLFDESGSMGMASMAAAARRAAAHVLSVLDPRRDEVAIFSFDSTLREVEPFTSDIAAVQERLTEGQPFGTTALFDAIAGAAQSVARRPGRRRALIVLTDGVDTSSRLRPEQVSGIASAIDVPVYVLAVVSPLDHAGASTAVATRFGESAGDLANLAAWTGGHVFTTSAPAHASTAARQIVAELRHQYLIAFEAGAEPGWHPLELRVKERRAIVRARSGYVVGS